jgi:hypothetical protein
MLKNLKEGESLVAVSPDSKGKGYFIMIGDNYNDHCWAITQAELDKLHELTGRHYHKMN